MRDKEKDKTYFSVRFNKDSEKLKKLLNDCGLAKLTNTGVDTLIIKIKKVISNVLPSQKVETIKKLKQENKFIMMCGDGINDSPALASADIGVSVNSGTDIAIDSSDVILTKNDLGSIINLINISKKTIRNNYFRFGKRK